MDRVPVSVQHEARSDGEKCQDCHGKSSDRPGKQGQAGLPCFLPGTEATYVARRAASRPWAIECRPPARARHSTRSMILGPIPGRRESSADTCAPSRRSRLPVPKFASGRNFE